MNENYQIAGGLYSPPKDIIVPNTREFLNMPPTAREVGLFGRAGSGVELPDEELLAEYAFAEATNTQICLSAAANYQAQGWKHSKGSNYRVSKIELEIFRINTSAGNLTWLEIWNSKVAGSSHQTGIDSSGIFVNDISTTPGTILTYTWAGLSGPIVATATQYYFMIRATTATAGGFIRVAEDQVSATYPDGFWSTIQESGWVWSDFSELVDMVFKLYGRSAA